MPPGGSGHTLSPVTVIVMLLSALLVLARGILRLNRFVTKVDAVAFPRCEYSQGVLRKTRSLKQVLWGGYTCWHCGCEIDKWGREVL